tara:strand:- start:3480 stop:4088 length:609 start_codon:yes stop_codon:yes gene_type:complete
MVMKHKKFNRGGFTKGPSHADGGIPMVVKSTGQKVELEGGEGVINKKSMSDDKIYKVEGTPRQIASAINEIDGNGVQFDKGAKITSLEKGGEIYDLNICDRNSNCKNRYDMYADDGLENKKVGSATIRKNYDYPGVVEIKNISIDEPYSHPLTYTYFVKSIIDKNNRTGAILKIECLNNDCFEDLVEIGEMTENGENLIIKK